MKKIITTEDVRRSEYLVYDFIFWFITSAVMFFSIKILNSTYELNLYPLEFLSIGATLFSLILMFYYAWQTENFKKKTDNKFGKKLKQKLGIERLTFTKLEDNTLELHHKSFEKKEIKNFKKNGLTESDIKQLFKEQVLEDFKKLEFFLQNEEKNDGLRVTTYTHVVMFRVWNKRAREAGISFEVVEDHSQKPVGYKWCDWKKVVYRTTGGKAKKDSIPKSEDWKMYRLRSKCL